MKKRKKAKKSDSVNARRKPALIALAAVVLVIGAISAVSRQLVSGKQSTLPENAAASKDSNPKKYMTVKAAGQDVQIDPQTGKLKPLSAQQAQELAAGLKKLLNKSADGLTEVHHEDGSTSMELKDRFRNVVVAREREDGSLSMSCVDNPKAAASALGIDQKLLEEPKKVPTVPQQN